jgi:hypothetical protein
MTDTKNTAPAGIDLDNAALDKLEALAHAASTGPWVDGGHTVYQSDEVGGEQVCKHMSAEDSAFIAGANPATVLALIALARKAVSPSDATGKADAANAGGLPMLPGCLADRLYEAIGIARDRAEHAGSTRRIRKWDATAADLRAALSQSPATSTVNNGWLIALQTVVEMPDGKKELGYTKLDGIGVFTDEADAYKSLGELNLPIGWVVMHVNQLIPGYIMPEVATSAADPKDVGLEMAAQIVEKLRCQNDIPTLTEVAASIRAAIAASRKGGEHE